MNIWLAVSLILVVSTVYLLAIEIYSVAFRLTGMATSKVKFQVASMFTGAGYTTAESELIARDDKRRKIALACIYTGHIFSVVFMGLIFNVVFSVINHIKEGGISTTVIEWYHIVSIVTASLFVTVLILKIPPINKRFQNLLEKIAINSSKKNRHTNHLRVLDLYGKHALAELTLNVVPDYMQDKPLSEIGLTKYYSIKVLSIKRGNRIIDVTRDTMFKKGDILAMYGLTNEIKDAFINSINYDNKPKEKLDKSNEISLVSNYGKDALVEVFVEEVPSQLVGVTVIEAKLKEKYNINIGIIKRGDDYIPVTKDTIIQKGDTITLFGPYKNIKMLFKTEEN